MRVTAFIHSNMPGSMQSGWFFVGGAQGLRRAMDCFCSWRDAGDLGRAIRAFAYDPHRPSKIDAAATYVHQRVDDNRFVKGLVVPGCRQAWPGMPGAKPKPLNMYVLDVSTLPKVFATF